MFVYKKNELHDVWTVGFFDPEGEWNTESDHLSAEEAAAWCSYLNGGQPPGGNR